MNVERGMNVEYGKREKVWSGGPRNGRIAAWEPCGVRTWRRAVALVLGALALGLGGVACDGDSGPGSQGDGGTGTTSHPDAGGEDAPALEGTATLSVERAPTALAFVGDLLVLGDEACGVECVGIFEVAGGSVTRLGGQGTATGDERVLSLLALDDARAIVGTNYDTYTLGLETPSRPTLRREPLSGGGERRDLVLAPGGQLVLQAEGNFGVTILELSQAGLRFLGNFAPPVPNPDIRTAAAFGDSLVALGFLTGGLWQATYAEDPTQPEMLRDGSAPVEYGWRVRVDDAGHALVAGGSVGMLLLDESLTALGSWSPEGPGASRIVDVAPMPGARALLADADRGLWLVSVAEPSAVTTLSHVEDERGAFRVAANASATRFAYVTNDGTAVVIGALEGL